MMKTSRIATLGAFGFALLAPVACTEGGTTGPVAPPPPPGPAPDLIQTVTVAISGLEVTGSCDHDSIFESSGDGEFALSFVVTPSGSQARRAYFTGNRRFSETTHSINGAAVFNRNVTRGEDFIVEFSATEFDGILGADRQFNGLVRNRSHVFSGGGWGSGNESIVLTGSKARCGMTLNYSISAVTAG